MTVTPEHLNSILLTSAHVNVVMGASHMQSDRVSDDLQNVSAPNDPECSAGMTVATDVAYRGSGFSAISRTRVHEPEDNPDHYVEQAAASFPTAQDALAFVTTLAAKLNRCAGHSLTTTSGSDTFRNIFGPLVGTPPTVSLTRTQEGTEGWRCQRALHAVLNLVLDVEACGLHLNGQANQIAEKMAAAIPRYQSTPTPPPTQSAQTVLPITGLADPVAIAVANDGYVYVADGNGKRVLKLSPDSNTQTGLAFTGLASPNAVAVDTAGNVYVVDTGTRQVLKLPNGSNTPTALPFTGLSYPFAVAVDAAGAVYVTDGDKNSVVELPPGSTTQRTLPFSGLKNPGAVHVDKVGNVYVSDESNRVLKLATGSNTQAVLPLTGLDDISDLTVDDVGNVYVASRHTDTVVKLAAGSNTQTTLAFTGLSSPSGVAVDSAGAVYVSDEYNGRVVKLLQH
jgi:DNA-binding beta-propeller fold protein YncE